MTASTAGSALADTNVLVYCYDEDDAEKHRRAKALVRELMSSRRLVLSAQVLNEFFAVVMKPSRPVPMTLIRAARIVQEYVATCDILPLTERTTLLALAGVARHGLSFWDALIWAAAKENRVALIYSEDFQHGRDVEGVRFENPFLAPPPP